jgi:hypothetical protein
MNTQIRTKGKIVSIFSRMRFTFRMWFLAKRIRKLNNSLHIHFVDWYKDEWERDKIVALIAHDGFRTDYRVYAYNWLEVQYNYLTKHKNKSEFVTSLIRRQWREINESFDGCLSRNLMQQKSNQIKLTHPGKEFADSFFRLINTLFQDAEFGKAYSFFFGASIVGLIWVILKFGWSYWMNFLIIFFS